MENLGFYRVVGTFFQEKKSLTAKGCTVTNVLFSGVINLYENVGCFQDIFGCSDVDTLVLEKYSEKECLSFSKSYETHPDSVIHYKLFSKCISSEDVHKGTQKWVGIWTCGLLSGLVNMVTVLSDQSISMWQSVAEELRDQGYINAADIPIANYLDNIPPEEFPPGDIPF